LRQKKFDWLQQALCRDYTSGDLGVSRCQQNQKPNKRQQVLHYLPSAAKTNKSKLKGSSREMLKSMSETELRELARTTTKSRPARK
jgi:Protein of unknwon function (DUF3008)